jgi:hypothetical protein
LYLSNDNNYKNIDKIYNKLINLKKMRKTTLSIIVYVLGLVFGALVLGLWDAKTTPNAFLGIAWTTLFLIALFYAEKNEQK